HSHTHHVHRADSLILTLSRTTILTLFPYTTLFRSSNVFNAKQQYFLNRIRFNTKFSDFGAIEHDGKIYFTSSRDEGVAIKRLYGWNEQPFLDIYVTDKETKRQIDVHTSKRKGDVNSI